MMLRLGVAIVIAGLFAPNSANEMSPVAKKYLDDALDIIQKKSIKQQTDWAKCRTLAYKKAADAQTTADTYPAIRDALAFLGDHHSGLFDPVQFKSLSAGRLKNSGMECIKEFIVRTEPNGPAEAAGLHAGMRIISLNGRPYDPIKSPIRRLKEPFKVEAKFGESAPKTYSVTPAEHFAIRAPSGRIVDGKFAYLDVPAFAGPEKAQLDYAQRLQDLIHEFEQKDIRGWIIDLRLNDGGNMWPMLAGLGPLFPDGDLGAFVDAAGNRNIWRYSDGKSSEDSTVAATTPHPYRLSRKDLPIAVLTDELTASSGEAVAIAFRGLPNAISIGQPTFGVPTGNALHALSDGAMINLCGVIDADRTGRTYDSKIPPDKLVETNWARFNQKDDSGILAAIKWIARFKLTR